MKRVALRRRLLLLVAAGLLPVAVMSGLGLHALYREQRTQTERTALELARAMSTAIDNELQQSFAALQVLASSPRLDTGDLRAFRGEVERVMALHPNWRETLLIDLDGRVLVDASSEPLPALREVVESASLRECLRTGMPVVGQMARGPRGRWGFPMRVPVIRGGQSRYVLTAVVRPGSMLAVAERQHLDPGWVMTSLDSAGNRVIRWPGQETYLGTRITQNLRDLMAQGAQGTGITNTADGHAVFTAFSRSPQSGWSTAVGIPVEQVQASALRSALAFGGGIALSLLLGAAAAGFIARGISRPMEALREAARAVGAGRAPAPATSDIREVQDVSEALVEASDARAAAARERDELLRSERAARAAAEAASRAKDEFLAMLGHELRNPLGALSNAAMLLDTAGTQASVAARARGIISRQVAHLSRLTEDLLDAGRALTGKIVLRREPMDLSAAALQSITTLKASGRLGAHHVVHDLRSVWVDADPVRLDQVIGNLLVNAVKYTPAGGTIRVGVKADGNEAVLSVADDGIGMGAELAGRVFELFVQGERQLDRSQGGLGIGLTLVRRLAQMHGGSANAYSGGDNRGSEFVVRLPAMAAPARQVEAEDAAIPAMPRSILVVEDNDDGRESLRMLLEALGHTVHVANDGNTGLERAMSLQPEIILLDIGLPGIDGYEVARRLRSRPGARRPFLAALTGYGGPEDRDRAFAAGFDAHVAKPVDRARLASLLAAAARALRETQER
ncbi:MAG TPA: ATP-binding protein [Usitatibacter sp.]|jgi:signal transduction histidine kinase/ActR/RegA family two-component response regulator|nr:ATP-binding protein [Usitatibacter sp.]